MAFYIVAYTIQDFSSLIINLGIAQGLVVVVLLLAGITARDIGTGIGSIAHYRRLPTRIIILDHVWNILSQHTSRFPFIVRRQISQPANPVMFLDTLLHGRRVITRRLGLVILVIYNPVDNPASRTRCID